MNLPRFFLADLKPHSSLELSEAESHHLARVLRMEAGAQIEVFDGVGNRCLATIRSVHKNSTKIETFDLEAAVRQRQTEITLATSLPKGDRQKWLVEKLTELGVDRVIPLETERGVAQPTDNALERLERVALEACKQSRNDRLLKIDPPRSLNEINSILNSQTMKLLAHPYVVENRPNCGVDSEKNATSMAEPVVQGMRSLQQWLPHTLPQQIVIAIGPEGGFTDQEVELALQSGWSAWVLTNTILRVETAVMMSAILALDFVTHP